MIKQNKIVVNVSNEGVVANYYGKKIISKGTELFANNKWIIEDRSVPVSIIKNDSNYISIGYLDNDIDVTDGNAVASVITGTYWEDDNNYQKGWVCPKCGGVYSPNQNYCPYCTPPIDIKVTYNTGDYVNPNINQSISVVDTGSTKIN